MGASSCLWVQEGSEEHSPCTAEIRAALGADVVDNGANGQAPGLQVLFASKCCIEAPLMSASHIAVILHSVPGKLFLHYMQLHYQGPCFDTTLLLRKQSLNCWRLNLPLELVVRHACQQLNRRAGELGASAGLLLL